MRRFLTRVSLGGMQALIIDPGTLQNLQIYYDGRTGMTTTGTAPNMDVTRWADESGNTRDTIQDTVGVAGPPLLHGGANGDSTGGLVAAYAAVQMDSGINTFRGMSTGSLQAIDCAAGQTQYLLARMPNGTANQAMYGIKWPSGTSSAPGLLFQSDNYDGSNGNVYFGPSAPGHLIYTLGSTGFDGGVKTPTGTWELYTLVWDTTNTITLYWRGQPIASSSGHALQNASGTLEFSAISSGLDLAVWYGAYLFYNVAQSAQTIKGVYQWFRQQGAS